MQLFAPSKHQSATPEHQKGFNMFESGGPKLSICIVVILVKECASDFVDMGLVRNAVYHQIVNVEWAQR